MQASKQQVQQIRRLKNRVEFLNTQRNGRKWISKSVIVEAAANNLGIVRYGLTVSKKVSKSAVVRNRIRRRLRAAACDILPVHVRPGIDIVLVGRAESGLRTYAQLKEDLRWCLEKLAVGNSIP